MGSTVSILVRIRNSTIVDITSISVFDVDNFDFGSSLKPDKVFNGLSIPSKSCTEKTLELNTIASNCPFGMKLTFRDGSQDVFKINSRCAYDSTEPNLRHVKQSHSIHHKRGPRILEIIVQHTATQLENQKAEQLNDEANFLLSAGKYQEASIKLLEAAEKAREDQTKEAIRRSRRKLEATRETDVDKKAESLNEEGMRLMKENRYIQAMRTFNEAIITARSSVTIKMIEDNLKNAKDAKANQDAKKLNQEGLLFKKNFGNEEALQKFEEALKLATDNSLIKSIKTNKADTLIIEAHKALDSAWLAESFLTDKNDEAIYKFAKAKFLFEQADSIKSDLENQKSIELIDIKVEGNRLFNIALQLQNEGASLVDKTVQTELSNNCKLAKEKYEKAWQSYKEAKMKYEEGLRKGDNKFKLSLQMTKEALSGVEKIINELEKVEFEMAL